jgi:hypothetical protein
MKRRRITHLSLLVLLAALGCSDPEDGSATGDTGPADVDRDADEADAGDGDDLPDAADATPDILPDIPRDPPPPNDGIYGYAHGCYTVEGFDGRSVPTHLAPAQDGESFAFSAATPQMGARFHMRASDLGTYLFYDTEGRYLTAAQDETNGWRLPRAAKLTSSFQLADDSFKSPAEWTLQVSATDPERHQLLHYQTSLYLALDGLTQNAEDAAVVTLHPASDCATFPELGLDATGVVTGRAWDDGDVYGIAEIHSHMMANFGFGGGGIFHGAPFHRLGVEQALPDCEPFHGEDGRRDLAGFFYDGDVVLDVDALLPIILSGMSEDFNHFTAGYPEFTDWPNSWSKSTHQAMYYRWLERAYLSGLRLLVQHATGNSILCEMIIGIGQQPVRYSCNDMVSVDRSILETRALERYIDAQAGGPGKGWFRVVETPEQARRVIGEGKLAVVLGIEISNLFDCFSTPKEGFETCTPESVRATLDHYQGLGVQAIFPVHKYDNAFSPGDGGGGIIELGNLVNSGHYSNFVEDCPGPASAFDGGNVTFGGLNRPRDEYDAPPPIDTSGFADNVVGTLLPFLDEINEPSLEGNWCQKHGLTPLGETLVTELMARGMMIDVAHLPQRALGRTYELLEAQAYPATKTHGGTNDGRLYRLGGLAGSGFGRCSDPENPGGMAARFRRDVDAVEANGGYPSEALGFDFNGFAGGPRPRFGDDSHCAQPQQNPITYPFTSYDGQITFEQPHLGNREVDFNTEGMIHVGLLPEYLEDVRRDGASDEDLEPLFRSAEAYLRLWETARQRAGLSE